MKPLNALLISVLFLISCCPSTSLNPLSDPNKSEIDKELIGHWKCTLEKDEDCTLVIGKKSRYKMEAIGISHKSNSELDIVRFPFFITISKKSTFINLRIEDFSDSTQKGDSGYIFAKYNLIDEDTLLFYLMSDEPIISAVRSNRLKGEITYKKQVKGEGQDNISPLKKPEIDCVTVTDTSHNILDFIHSADQNQLFPEALEFKRIK